MKQTGPSVSMVGLMRQAPLAIALAVAYAISPYGRLDLAPLDGQQVLMIVILIGLASDAMLLISTRPPQREVSA